MITLLCFTILEQSMESQCRLPIGACSPISEQLREEVHARMRRWELRQVNFFYREPRYLGARAWLAKQRLIEIQLFGFSDTTIVNSTASPEGLTPETWVFSISFTLASPPD